MPKRAKIKKVRFKKRHLKDDKYDIEGSEIDPYSKPDIIEGYNYRKGGAKFTRKSKGFTSIRKAS